MFCSTQNKRKTLIRNSVFPVGVKDLSLLGERYPGRFPIKVNARLSGCCSPSLGGFGLLVDECDPRWRELIRQNRRTGDTVFDGGIPNMDINYDFLVATKTISSPRCTLIRLASENYRLAACRN